jgi:hypothetical protein
MNLGVDVVAFCLFFSLLVFFFPLATLWPIRRWIHIGDDAYNIDPLHQITVEVHGIIKISFPFHY